MYVYIRNFGNGIPGFIGTLSGLLRIDEEHQGLSFLHIKILGISGIMEIYLHKIDYCNLIIVTYLVALNK